MFKKRSFFYEVFSSLKNRVKEYYNMVSRQSFAVGMKQDYIVVCDHS